MSAKYVAEFLGTFLFVFIACGAAALAGGNILITALAFGIALAMSILLFGPVSGGNFNPAVSAGLAVTGQMPYGQMVGYIIAQCLGAIVAAALLAYLIGTSTGLGASVGSLTGPFPWKAVLIEAILTFALVTAVFATAVSGTSTLVTAIAVGGVLLVAVLFAGTLTGASLNPARSLGPALFTGNMGSYWIYLLGPMIGGILAAIVYWKFFIPGKVCGKVDFGC